MKECVRGRMECVCVCVCVCVCARMVMYERAFIFYKEIYHQCIPPHLSSCAVTLKLCFFLQMKNFSSARLFTALVHKLLERSFSCAHFSFFFFFIGNPWKLLLKTQTSLWRVLREQLEGRYAPVRRVNLFNIAAGLFESRRQLWEKQ